MGIMTDKRFSRALEDIFASSKRLKLFGIIEEFGEKGFHEASISRITARAGVAIGTFYTYFESKEEVFRALVRDMSRATRAHVAEAVQYVGVDPAQGVQLAPRRDARSRSISGSRRW